MVEILLWYVLIMLIGAAALPLAYSFMPHLADRGYALARPLGLLLWGFIFWLLASFQILQNNTGSMLLALAILVALSIWKGSRIGWRSLWEGLKQRKGYILSAEIFFLIAFAAWAVVRSASPNIEGTEKPMELAFINAILSSPNFPPHDPWLSGYAISYYYFGYVIVAMLIRVTGVISGAGFNLASAAWFSLTGLAAYGIVYNLLAHWSAQRKAAGKPGLKAVAWAFLAPFTILIVSNLEGLLEVIHAKGWFWQTAADGTTPSGFWAWLNILELNSAPATPFSFIPNRPGGVWWWRASRVLGDFNLAGVREEVIDEFPFFSYYLADLHPHVLAMPFLLLAVCLALNLYLSGSVKRFAELGVKTWLRQPDFLLSAVVIGGLGFMNTWDFPVAVVLIAAVFGLVRYQQEGWNWGRVVDFLKTALMFGAAGYLLYLPFYLGFANQAGGILPSGVFFTRGVHFWIMFGVLLLPICVWLGYEVGQHRRHITWGRGLKFGGLLVGGLWLLSIAFCAVIGVLGGLSASLSNLVSMWLGLQGADSVGTVISQSLQQRFAAPVTWITLLGIISAVWALFSAIRAKEIDTSTEQNEGKPQPVRVEGFVLLLVIGGAGLTLFPEFFYLRDQFATRMNTIFKFYFQTWIVWSLAACFAVPVLWRELKKVGWVFRVIWLVVIASALIYPVYGLWDRLSPFDTANWTLDGTAQIAKYNPDEAAGIAWLKKAEPGVVAEAVGGSYSGYARIATQTGLSNVIGWPGHESQWRGGSTEMGSRMQDIQRLYETSSWEEARTVIQMYNIRYIYIGSLESSTYPVNDLKFKRNLVTAFQQGGVTIFEVPFDILPGGALP